jgi:hypothetical protein
MTTGTPVAEQVAALNAGMAAQSSREVLSAFGAEQAALDSAGVPDGVLAPGAEMPDGDLEGILRWIDVHPDYTTCTEPAAVLEALASILD